MLIITTTATFSEDAESGVGGSRARVLNGKCNSMFSKDAESDVGGSHARARSGTVRMQEQRLAKVWRVA
jgi:hypothetical protein